MRGGGGFGRPPCFQRHTSSRRRTSRSACHTAVRRTKRSKVVVTLISTPCPSAGARIRFAAPTMLVGGYNKTPYESVATTGPSMMAERAAWRTTWLETPIPALLKNSGRWLLLIALPAAMITPRIQVGGVHVTASDVLGLMGGVSWLLACVTRPTARISLAGAKWPLVVLWLLPAIAVPNLFDSSAGRRRLLTSISLGSVLAGIANLWTAMMVGFANGI